MKHLEQFKVAFLGRKGRQHAENGVTQSYYRNVFELNGNFYSVKDSEDLSGMAGVVMFVKKGEPNPNGGVVNADAFSLVFASKAGAIAESKVTLTQLMEG